jgi:hypothetical protein
MTLTLERLYESLNRDDEWGAATNRAYGGERQGCASVIGIAVELQKRQR